MFAGGDVGFLGELRRGAWAWVGGGGKESI